MVDDGSTDDSVKIIEGLQSQYDSIRLVRSSTNRGIVASVRSGLEVATGEYLLLASSDDFVLPGLFSHAFAGLSEYPDAAFFCSGVALVDNSDRVTGLRPFAYPRRSRGYMSPAAVRSAIRGTDFWFIGTSTVYRRKLLAEIGYFDERLGSITDVLSNRLLAFRHGFYFDPAVLAAYNKDPKSFSGRSALSVEGSCRRLDAAKTWIAENLPEDIRDEHGPLFDRRMRFAFARLWVIWSERNLDANAIAEILNMSAFDRKILVAFSRVPVLSSFLVLVWMTLRMCPFSLLGIVEASWRAFQFRWLDRGVMQREVNRMVCPNSERPAGTGA